MIANLKISYNIEKSCYLKENKLAVINLTIENKSANSTSILTIKLINGSKSYFAAYPKMQDADQYTSYEDEIKPTNDDEFEFNDRDILSENILKNVKLSKHAVLNGYAIFENVETMDNSKCYKIIVETPGKTFKKEIKELQSELI